jgi:hypothetical protein
MYGDRHDPNIRMDRVLNCFIILSRIYYSWPTSVAVHQYTLWQKGVRDGRIHDSTLSLMEASTTRDTAQLVQ